MGLENGIGSFRNEEITGEKVFMTNILRTTAGS